ncbi:MAG: type II secretion system protein [Phycisphaerae bacterium]
MLTRKRKSGKKGGFTIIEMLTVMSIIVILIGLLVPAVNQVRRYAREVRQKAQFHSISIAMNLFQAENGEYPDSGELGGDGLPYCGAMKLAEAMVGQDILGYHPDSVFRSDRRNSDNTRYLYRIAGVAASETDVDELNRSARKGPYLQPENANATRMEDIYGTSLGDFTGANAGKIFVLCDVFSRTIPATGLKMGMPILYYRARLEGSVNPNRENAYAKDYPNRIYRHEDNDDLVALGVPWSATVPRHPLDDLYNLAPPAAPPLPESFYWRINNDNIPLDDGRPYKADSYILISAGEDGLYGTADDIYNFQRQ